MTVTRGTTNGNVRGSAYTRRARREWLVETYRANKTVVYIWDVENGADVDGPPTWVTDTFGDPAGLVRLQEKCGRLLTVETVTVDRIIPGCQGGTYRRDNIRPACGPCNSETGGGLRSKRVRS